MKLPEEVEVAGVEHTAVTVNGFAAHVATAGDTAGEPVVLLHGWPLHWWSFRHLIRMLADDRRRVIAPDLRGFGWSGTPGWGYGPEAPERFRRYVAMSVPGPHTRYTARALATLWRYWYQQPLALPVIGPRTVRGMRSPRSLVGRSACAIARRGTTLHLHGTKDGPTSPAFVRPMAGRSGHWRLELLDGVGHFLLDEAPERVERLVRPFLV